MPEPQSKRGKTKRQLGMLGGLVLAAVLLGALGLLLILSAFIGNSPERTAAEPRQSQSGVSTPLPESGPPLQVGDRPYAFALEDLEGNTVHLSQFIGQPIMVNFWATWCGPCRIEMPEMQAAYEAYRDEGFVILAVNQGESAALVRQFYAELGLTYPALLDPESSVVQSYGTGNFLPSSLFIAPNGEITAIHRGPLTREQLAQYLRQTLPG